MAEVRLEAASKTYAGRDFALGRRSIQISDYELLVILGPSGGGKSTILRLIAGLEAVDDGAIYIGNRNVTRLSPGDRDVAMVFRNYALYPHMTVRENLVCGLELRGVSRTDITSCVTDVADTLGLPSLLQQKPRSLSVDEHQRLALGRAIMHTPGCISSMNRCPIWTRLRSEEHTSELQSRQ